ncbi:MAG TPA: hypothetical protein VLQ68_04200, partial [Rhizobiaceae bacterium]|nr:hypothetical protein [Rhizobiaceae bacterium]
MRATHELVLSGSHRTLRPSAPALLAALLALAGSPPASAANYGTLASQGFKAGPMTRNSAGTPGWNVSNGAERYFCSLGAALAIVSKTQMVAFTSSGRTVPMDRRVFESKTSSVEGKYPKLSDLKAGRL